MNSPLGSWYPWPQQWRILTVTLAIIILTFVYSLFFLNLLWEKSPTAILPASLSLVHIKERNSTGLAQKSKVCHLHFRDRVSDDRGDATSDVYMKWFMSLSFVEGEERHVGSDTSSKDQGIVWNGKWKYLFTRSIFSFYFLFFPYFVNCFCW